ncbi:MAG: choline dehydrogenase [Dehalococcoidia bacterium]|nr:choline dehydrogenase [Dehalococcoidia bacterium]
MARDRAVYDVVVVGAGSAGAVIAARASEDPNRRVLLIEAGPDYPLVRETPDDLLNGHHNSLVDHDWGFDYQPTARGRSNAFPRGRVTGGSSAVNTTIALRGVPEDYDGWAAEGNNEWAWEKVLPAFRRLERDLDFGDRPYHGDAGPISIRRYPWDELTETHQAFLEASRTLGYPDCEDANDPDAWGAGPHSMNKLGRLRVSTALGYLAPARVRANLEICGDTHTRRLIVQDGRVTAVEVEQGGEVRRIEGRLFVLSAGAIQSPAVLMRSGIGPRRDLEALGIDVVRDVPGVGANLSDHPAVSAVCAVKDPALVDQELPLIQTILRYTAPGSEHRNDLQVELITWTQRRGDTGAFVLAAVLEQSYGRGVVRLTSADPHAKPVIEQRFCEDDRDTSRLVACFKDALEYTRTKPLAGLIDRMIFPDPDRPLDDEGIAEICRRFAGSGYHPCGTVKMGPSTDPGAVVDQCGRIHSVDGLVVADASIMPSVPRANTNLTSIMIGERVGEWIRTQPGDYGL